MPIDFPNGPTEGQIYTYQGKSWRYNGTGWDRITPAYGDDFLPAGSMIQWASNTIPTNWLLCDGAAVSRSTYSSLFAAIGTQYGVGDGSTTFNLPNLKGRVAVGRDSSQTEFDVLGETGGAKTHTLTINEMPSHNHQQSGKWSSFSSHNHYQVSGTAQASDPSQGDSNIMGNTYNTGGGAAHNNLQPYQVINYIIKTSAGTTAGDSELATRLGAVELGKAALTGDNTFTGNQVFNSGIVRITAQPAFSAMRRAGTLGNVSTPTAIVYDSTHLNNGSHYNTSNGRFTAPVNGMYRFDCKFQKRFGGAFSAYIYKNGVNFDRFIYSDLSGDSPGPGNSIIMYLNAGDYTNIFYVHTGGGDVYAAGEYFTSFTGHLIG